MIVAIMINSINDYTEGLCELIDPGSGYNAPNNKRLFIYLCHISFLSNMSSTLIYIITLHHALLWISEQGQIIFDLR